MKIDNLRVVVGDSLIYFKAINVKRTKEIIVPFSKEKI